MSAPSLAIFLPWLRQIIAAAAQVMEQTIGHLEGRYGSARNYMKARPCWTAGGLGLWCWAEPAACLMGRGPRALGQSCLATQAPSTAAPAGILRSPRQLAKITPLFLATAGAGPDGCRAGGDRAQPDAAGTACARRDRGACFGICSR